MECKQDIICSYVFIAFSRWKLSHLSLKHFLFVETGQIDPILIERYNTPGFVGCLSRVQFNSIAPLKAALRSGMAAPVSTHGILVPSNCGASPLTISPMASASDPWHIEAGRKTENIALNENPKNKCMSGFNQTINVCFTLSWSSFPLQWGQSQWCWSGSQLCYYWRWILFNSDFSISISLKIQFCLIRSILSYFDVQGYGIFV